MNLLSIGGSDPSSGAGIQSDLKIFSTDNVYWLTVITAITGQNTLKFGKVEPVSVNILKNQLQLVLSDFKIDGIKIGMVYDSEIIKIIYDDVGYHDIIVPCCDEQAYIRRYGLEGHRSCLENIREALLKIGERQHLSGELAWNMFMKNKIQEDGEVIYEEPIHPPGSKIILEVLMDCVIALSACPQDQTPTNGGNCSKMKINIWNKE